MVRLSYLITAAVACASYAAAILPVVQLRTAKAARMGKFRPERITRRTRITAAPAALVAAFTVALTVLLSTEDRSDIISGLGTATVRKNSRIGQIILRITHICKMPSGTYSFQWIGKAEALLVYDMQTDSKLLLFSRSWLMAQQHFHIVVVFAATDRRIFGRIVQSLVSTNHPAISDKVLWKITV